MILEQSHIWRNKCTQCEMDKRMVPAPRVATPTFCPDPNESNKQLRIMLQQSDDMLKLVKANFTQKMDYMKTELDNSNKDKDRHHLEAIELRRDKAYLQEELDLYQKKCKEDFVTSLQGIPNVTKEFLKRIDDLFSKHIHFQLTCEKQKHQLENIRENCSSLSREVENKLQTYLDLVGNQFTKINGENSKYVTENKRFREDADWCNQNRSAMVRENRRVLEQTQLKHDGDMKQLLLKNKKLQGENQLKEDLLAVKEREIKRLSVSVENLNTSLANCKPPTRTSFGNNPFGIPNIPSAGGTGFSSTGLNKPSVGWPGIGSGFPNSFGTGSSSSWGGLGSSASGSQGGTGSSRTGISQSGTSNLGGFGTGYGGAGSSAAATGHTGSGSPAFNSAASSGAGAGKPGGAGVGFGSAGSSTLGLGMNVGGGRTGSDSALLNQAQIINHLRELHRYSVPS